MYIVHPLHASSKLWQKTAVRRGWLELPCQNFITGISWDPHIVQVLDYYDKFKNSGDPLKSPIDQTEFLEIMQVQNVKKIYIHSLDHCLDQFLTGT